MNFWQLYIFAAVVEHKSFSKASRAIHLSQPTVSSHIKELEEHFQCRLLDRLGKTTEPTAAGRILYRYAKEILSLKTRAESALHDFLGQAKGHLTVGGSTIPSGYIFPRLIGPFCKKYPDVSVELTAGDTMQVIEDIKNADIEAGIVGAKINDPLVKLEKLIPDQMKLIVPANHRLAGKDTIDGKELLKLNFIGRETGSGTWQSFLNGFEQAGHDPSGLHIVMTMGNTISVIQGIINDIGVSVLSTISVQEYLDSGRLSALSVTGLDLNRHFYLALPTKRTISPICKKFIRYTRSFLKKQI